MMTRTSCDSCNYPAPNCEEYKDVGITRNLCFFCAHTLIANAQQYPNQYDAPQAMSAMAFIANTIIDATGNWGALVNIESIMDEMDMADSEDETDEGNKE